MNERIRELVQQAGFENGHQDRDGRSLSDELEKFAELIVRECISKYDEWSVHSSDRTSFSMARHNVRQTFGIE